MTENRIIRTYLTKNRDDEALRKSSVFEMSKNRVIRTYLTKNNGNIEPMINSSAFEMTKKRLFKSYLTKIIEIMKIDK